MIGDRLGHLASIVDAAGGELGEGLTCCLTSHPADALDDAVACDVGRGAHRSPRLVGDGRVRRARQRRRQRDADGASILLGRDVEPREELARDGGAADVAERSRRAQPHLGRVVVERVEERRVDLGRARAERAERVDRREAQRDRLRLHERQQRGLRARRPRLPEEPRELDLLVGRGHRIAQRRVRGVDRAPVDAARRAMIEELDRGRDGLASHGRVGVVEELEHGGQRSGFAEHAERAEAISKRSTPRCIACTIGVTPARACSAPSASAPDDAALLDGDPARSATSAFTAGVSPGAWRRARRHERVARGGPRDGRVLLRDGADEHLHRSVRADASERGERGRADLSRSGGGAAGLRRVAVGALEQRRDRERRVLRAHAAERGDRLDAHLARRILQREHERARRPRIAELAERARDRLAHLGHGVLHLADQRDDGARIADAAERPRDLDADLGRAVVEVAEERRHALGEAACADRRGRGQAHVRVWISEDAAERDDAAFGRRRADDLARGEAQACVALGEPGNHHVARARRAKLDCGSPRRRRTSTSGSAIAREASGWPISGGSSAMRCAATRRSATSPDVSARATCSGTFGQTNAEAAERHARQRERDRGRCEASEPRRHGGSLQHAVESVALARRRSPHDMTHSTRVLGALLGLSASLCACGSGAGPSPSQTSGAPIARTEPASLPSTAATASATAATAPRATPFAELVDKLSEPDGEFFSDNVISNETSYLQVAPQLEKAARPGGAYIGVGPEQNFTYIALTKPKVAFVVDIRRQNLVLHLLYKAAFEEATSRAHFVCAPARPPVRRAEGDPGAGGSLDAVLAHATKRKQDAASFAAAHAQIIARLERDAAPSDGGAGLHLSAADRHGLDVGHHAFFDGQLDTRFSLKEANGRAYPTLGELLREKDPLGNEGGFLASEAAFRTVQAMEKEGRIVPLVGDFAGDRAMPGVAAYLKAERLTVSAFYVSNVEQYLFEPKVWPKWSRNVSAMPTDDRSVFIRAYLDQGRRHPQQLKGQRTATTLQRVTDFLGHQAKQPYGSFWAVATERYEEGDAG